MRLLLTGATGMLGAEIYHQLHGDGGYDVTRVARRASTELLGVTWNIGNENPPTALTGHWDAIIHCAADTRWSQTREEARRSNIDSLQSLTALASPDTRVIHLSTAAVVGPFNDGSSEDPADYRNMYEWSKACAEHFVRQRVERLTIVRPPLVIGRRGDGRAARFAGMYMLLRGITSSSVPAVVGEPDAFFDVAPVDDVARVIISAIHATDDGEILTVAGGSASPRVYRFVDIMCDALNEWRVERGVAPVDIPPFLAPDSWTRFYRPFADDILSRRQSLTLDHLDNFLPYLRMTVPWIPTHVVIDAEAAIAPSVRYWADVNPRLASLQPRPWASVKAEVS